MSSTATGRSAATGPSNTSSSTAGAPSGTSAAVRLRAALQDVPAASLRDVFARADADGNGSVSAAELRRLVRTLLNEQEGRQVLGRASLGAISHAELSELVDMFDSDGDGTVSLQEFLDFLSPERDAASAAPGARLRIRICAHVLAEGAGELVAAAKRRGHSSEDDLSPEELCAVLTDAGIDGADMPAVRDMLSRVHTRAGVVSSAPSAPRMSLKALFVHLGAKQFVATLRRLMENAADVLEARGVSLESALLRVAMREQAKARAAGASYPVDADTGEPEITAGALRELLVNELGFPLTDEQLDAVLQAADVDGNGHCVIEEILFLAGVDADEDEETPEGEEDEEPEEDEAPLPSARETEAAIDPAACVRGAWDDVCTVTASTSATWWTPSTQAGRGDDAMPAADAAEACKPWRSVATAVFDVCAAADAMPTAAGAPGGAPPKAPAASAPGAPQMASGLPPVTVGARRLPQALAALGLGLPAPLVYLHARKCDDSGAGLLDLPTFLHFVDTVVDDAHQNGRGGLRPLAAARIRHAIAAAAKHVAAPTGVASSVFHTGSEPSRNISRSVLSAALQAVPAASLSEEEADCLAAYAPGALAACAIRAATEHMAAVLACRAAGMSTDSLRSGGRRMSAGGLATSTRRTSATGPSIERVLSAALAAADNDTPRSAFGAESKAADESAGPPRAASAAPASLPVKLTPDVTALAQLPLILAVEQACVFADIQSEVFMRWLTAFAALPAVQQGLRLSLKPMPAPVDAASRPTYNEDALSAWRVLPLAAQRAVMKLLSPIVNVPVTGDRFVAHVTKPAGETQQQSLMPSTPFMSRSGLPRTPARPATIPEEPPAGITPHRVESVTVHSAYLALLPRLPMSFQPSVLAALAAVSPSMSLERVLADGGLEADPSGTLAPALPSVPTAATPTIRRAILSDSACANLRAGQGVDGLGLPLRLASLLPGAPEPKTSWLGGAQPTSDSVAPTPLRPIGCATTATDMAWASEGLMVRPQELTAIITLSIAKGIPSPSDESVRSLVTARVARVAIVEMISPFGDSHPPRLRLLSNCVACPAAWSPLTEDEWSFPTPTASPTSKLVLRCDQPRDSAQAGASAMLLLELNVSLAGPPLPAPPVQSDPEAPAGRPALSQLVHADGYSTEEIVCAWACVPLASLALNTTGSQVVRLVGGTATSQMDIALADILQRRSNWRALAKGIGGTVRAPEITLQCTNLSRLRAPERQELARLPLCCVVPEAAVKIVTEYRRALLPVATAAQHAAALGRDVKIADAALVAFSQALQDFTAHSGGSAGGSVATLLALAQAYEKAVAAGASQRPKQGSEAAMRAMLMRLLSATSYAGNGLLPPAIPMADLAARSVSSTAPTAALAGLTSADTAYMPFSCSTCML